MSASTTTARSLSAADLDRLLKLCGLFGSDQMGERANAAALADRFLRERGMRWSDVLAAPGQPPPESKPSDNPWEAALTDWPKRWRDAVDLCVASPGLSDRDIKFLFSISRYRRLPTDRQMDWLLDIIDQIIGRRA